MAATWEEIRQLQADFAHAQLAKNAQKLSERNCVELVLRLVDLKLIDVVHTIGMLGWEEGGGGEGRKEGRR